MLNIIEKYILNFWIWWYYVEHKRFAMRLFGFWVFAFHYMNIGPMARHIFSPLYQDQTYTGMIISFPIRLTWVICGSIFQVFFALPLICVYLLYIIMPISPLLALWQFSINWP